jgi:hypothetical protein
MKERRLVDLWHPQTNEERALRGALSDLALEAITATELHIEWVKLSDWCGLRAAVTEEEGRRLLAEAREALACMRTSLSPLLHAPACPCAACQRERHFVVIDAQHCAHKLLVLRLVVRQPERAEHLACVTLAYYRTRDSAKRAQDGAREEG